MSADGKRPGERLNLVDRLLTYFNPQYGLRAMAARNHLHQFGYNDHPERRGDSGGRARNAASETPANARDVVAAMWDARSLLRFNWIGGTLAKIVLYVIGELECKSNTGDPELDAIYDTYFHAWCGDEEDEEGRIQCDFSGRFRLIELLQMAFLAEMGDGDHGFVWRKEPDPFNEDRARLMLQSIEADRIGSPIEAQALADNYVRGFTLDLDTGRVQAIRVFRRNRNGLYVDPVEVEPIDFIHVWDPKRADQYRGITALLPILNDIRHISEWDEAEMIAGKTQSQFAALVGTSDPYARTGGNAWEGRTKEGTNTQQAVWGKIIKLIEGEKFGLLAPPSRPSAAFQQFVSAKLRKIAIALGFSFEFVWDMSGLGGVSQRVAVRSDERRVFSHQRRLAAIATRIRKRVLAHGVTYDHLPAHPQMNRCHWHFGERIITDAGYEVQNDLLLVQNGMMDPDDVATKYNRGRNLREIAQRKATILQSLQTLASESGMPIELLVGNLFPNATQLLAAMQSEHAPPPKPGSLDAVGDKGAAQIIDVLSKVTTGQMDRDAAIQTLVTVYQIPPAKAEDIVPPAPKQKAVDDADQDRG